MTDPIRPLLDRLPDWAFLVGAASALLFVIVVLKVLLRQKTPEQAQSPQPERLPSVQEQVPTPKSSPPEPTFQKSPPDLPAHGVTRTRVKSVLASMGISAEPDERIQKDDDEGRTLLSCEDEKGRHFYCALLSPDEARSCHRMILRLQLSPERSAPPELIELVTRLNGDLGVVRFCRVKRELANGATPVVCIEGDFVTTDLSDEGLRMMVDVWLGWLPDIVRKLYSVSKTA